MRFRFLTEQIFFRPWFITAGGHLSIQHVYSRALARRNPLAPVGKAAGASGQELLDQFEAAGIGLGDLINSRQALSIDREGIATVHVLGPLARNLTNLERACGATGFEEVRADIESAITQGAKGILLRMDSPGGTVNGTPELSRFVARRLLPTVVHSSDLIASAAYSVAAGADAIIISESAQAGSIGTLYPWIDFAEEMKMMGLRPDPIVSAGSDLKGIGFSGTLTGVQREHLQEEANQLTAAFKAHVLTYRSVPDSAMRGQTLFGRDALAANLVDGLGELADARAKLLSLI